MDSARRGWRSLTRRIEFTCLLPVCARDDVQHFDEAAQSLRASTVKPAEILICQDGELPAPLAQAVTEFAKISKARMLRHSGPRGLHHNLNHAIAAVRTPWIARCDADDINHPERFEAQTRALSERPEIGVLGGDIVEFWPDGRERRKAMPVDHDDIVAWAKWRSPINHNTVFYRTEDVIGVGGYPDLAFKEDYGLWLRLLSSGARFANLRRDLVRARLGASFYRRRGGLKNLRSEWGIYRLRTQLKGFGGVSAILALVSRAGALSAPVSTRLVYEWGLRR